MDKFEYYKIRIEVMKENLETKKQVQAAENRKEQEMLDIMEEMRRKIELEVKEGK